MGTDMMNEMIEKMNGRLLTLLSHYLNENPDLIDSKMVNRLKESCDMSEKEALSILLAVELGIDFDENEEDRFLYENYFGEMIHDLSAETYQKDSYYSHIVIPNKKIGSWELKEECYQPYELFVMADMDKKEDGRIIPQLGFFKEKFSFPVVLQSNREWMLITPNEIETMKESIAHAEGNVLTSGLGLGYFAYMCSEKENVRSVTIVERDEEVISLFERFILNQFPHRDKIKIVHDDAFEYFKNTEHVNELDFVFWDLWHDVQDGLGMYKRLKEIETFYPQIKFEYWIEKTMRCYLED